MTRAQIMTAKQAAPRTLLEAVTYFANEDVAHAFLAMLRWPDGQQTCPKCGTVDQHMYLETQKRWKCRSCRKQFSIKVGTIFEDSPIKLSKWLPAVWFIVNCKNGISSHELGRALGVTQKSAWFMLQRIRLAMQAETFEKLSGTVEADESFIGGKRRNMHRGKQRRVAPKLGSTQHMSTVIFDRPACSHPQHAHDSVGEAHPRERGSRFLALYGQAPFVSPVGRSKLR
jgi:transposase-like protein